MASVIKDSTTQYGVTTLDTTIAPIGEGRDAQEMVVNTAVDIGKQTNSSVSSLGPAPLERWNQPRSNIYRYLGTIFSFITMGMNDASSGVSVS
jgi:hypothetical protein